jgi:hypothetical protein
MKKIFTLLIGCLTCTMVMAQQNNPPVAVNDTVSCRLGHGMTVNVINNDYDPDGDTFYIALVGKGSGYIIPTFTDSTITFYITEYLHFGGFTGYVSFLYLLKDEHGEFNNSSIGYLVVNVINDSYDSLNVNSITARINAYGSHFFDMSSNTFGYNGGTTTYNYPSGSRKSTLFKQSLWIGGKDGQGNLRISAERYRQDGMDFFCGPLSTDGNCTVDSASLPNWYKIWKINASDIEYHVRNYNQSGYIPLPAIRDWPAHGDPLLKQAEYIAPFVDTDGDGVYNPLAGDYPLIRGDQCIFFVFNDMTLTGRETGNSTPMGIEVHGMAYAFLPYDSVNANTMFITYKIFNRSNVDYTDVYLGIWADFDIGHAYDDYVQCDVEGGYFFAMNGDSIDGNGEPEAYGENPPVQAIVVLGGAYLDADNLDNPAGGCDFSINGVNFGDGVVDNERLGLTGFMFNLNSASPINGDPRYAEQYYQYLSGLWKDGSQMLYGGGGHYSLGAYGPASKFMFPGSSDICHWGTGGTAPFGPIDWTMESSGYTPNDVRGLGITGPFSFPAGGYQQVDLAFVTARSFTPGLTALDVLRNRIDSLKVRYYQSSEDFGRYFASAINERPANLPSFDLRPNPAHRQFVIRLHSTTGQAIIQITDLTGRTCYSGLLYPGDNNVDIANLKPGIYLVQVIENHLRSVKKLIVR